MGSICIFAHFNKNNSLEECVEKLDYLETIKELVDEVIFISTSDIDKDKRSLLKKIVSKIIIKDNKVMILGLERGFDLYKKIIMKICLKRYFM